jgi:hypothetical protein
MREYYNIENVKALMDLPASIMKDFVENPLKKHKNKDGDKFYWKHVKIILKDIIKCGDGKSVVYNFKDNGRQYTGLGSQGLPSHIKSLVLNEDYKDYDLVNAHFNILYNLCIKHNIPCNLLKKYASNRDELLKEHSFKKMDAIIWFFTDKPKPKHSNRFIINFIEEMKQIKNQLLFKLNIKTDNPEKKPNIISSLVCKVLCTEENEILEKALNHFKIEDGVKMFDGFMTREDIDINELNEITGYNWAIKERPVAEIPKNIKSEAEGLVIDWANIYYEKNKKDWVINKFNRGFELYHFNKRSGLWNRVNAPYEELRSDIRNGGMLNYLQSSQFLEDYQHKDLSNLEKFVEQFINKHSTITNLTSLIYDKLIYDWVENVEFDNLDHIINFKNKCYDLNLMKSVKREREHYSTITARYLDEENKDFKRDLLKIISDIHPDKENRRTYLQLLCNTLSGKALEKCVFCNGVGANGKGLMHGGLMRSLLGDYYYTADNKTLTERSNGANQSLANLHKKRMVVFEEPDEKTPINFNMIKTMTGGKVINARGLYEKNDQTILSLVLFIECNKKPDINGDTGNSMMRRLLNIQFPSCFKEETDPTYRKEKHKIANPRLKDTDILEQYSSQLFYILIDFMKDEELSYYNMDKIKVSDSIFKDSKQYIDSNNTILELVNEICDPIPKEKIKREITKDTLKAIDLYKCIKTTDTWLLSTNKFKKQLGKNNFFKELNIKEEYEVELKRNVLYILNYEIKETPPEEQTEETPPEEQTEEKPLEEQIEETPLEEQIEEKPQMEVDSDSDCEYKVVESESDEE